MSRLAPPATDDPSELSPSGPYRALKQLGLALLCAAWVLLGLAGHDPWKTEDATTFGIAWEMAERGDYVVPHLAGEVNLARPPFVPAAAALAMSAFAPPLVPHNAARLVAGIALALILVCVALASRELAGRPFRWLPVLILIGSIGFWDRAHALSPELGLTLGVAAALYGFALALSRPVAGGVLLGVGAGIAFLSRGLVGPMWLAATALLLPAFGGVWRTRRHALAAGVGLVVAVAVAAPWLVALQGRDPALLAAWWAGESSRDLLGIGSATGTVEPFYHLKNLLWFSWPALPLILWMLWTRGRGFNGGLAGPELRLPAVLALVIVGSLVIVPDPRLIHAMPLLVPLALLAALEVDSLKRGFSGFLDWFGILTFGLLSLLMWALWIDSYTHGMSAAVARMVRDSEIGFQPRFHLGTILAALFLTALWVVLVRPARRSNRRAVLNWAAGMTLLWGLYGTIWLPYLDSRRSYRSVVEAAASHLPAQGCVGSRYLGEPQRALFHYFANVVTVRAEVDAHAEDCPALLVQYGRQEGVPPSLPGWQVEWEGRRRGDDTERYVIYVKEAP
ncbi:MAG: glycosyltransferase family 39 protein [Betaproteobacteria bacterium]